MMRLRREVYGWASLALGALAIGAFYDAAQLHGNYRHLRHGLSFVPRDELAFLLWYGWWGGLAMLSLGVAIYRLLGARLVLAFDRCATRPVHVLVLLALPVFVGVLALRAYVLGGEPVADDELVYEFSARNLVLGKLTSVPPIDPDFLRNQFIVIDGRRWHGKYPLGHSLLLAPFELLGRVDLLGGSLALANLAATYAVARRLIGERAGFAASLLLAVSPHFLLTHATLLSQTSSSLLTLLAVLASLRHDETQAARWLVLMGAVLGLGVCTRPMPLLLVAVVLIAERVWHAGSTSVALRQGLYWGAPLAAFAALFLWVNYVQSESPWSSGHKEWHQGALGTFQNIQGELTNSLGGALVRENAWLFGWPWSLLFVPFARLPRKAALAWGIVATGLVYRLVVPKTVVASTGPIYITELVPWLCITSVSGMQRVHGLLIKLELPAARERVAALAAAGFVVAGCTFWPIETRELVRGARAREGVKRALLDQGTSRALVFCDTVIDPTSFASWAYFAPNPWPDLRDDVLYLRVPPGTDGMPRALRLWQDRFPDRPAFLYVPSRGYGTMCRLDAHRPGTCAGLRSQAIVESPAETQDGP
ncbi:MAG TPA: glycosyltransferase family 39 protein [Polyangiales bacterium]